MSKEVLDYELSIDTSKVKNQINSAVQEVEKFKDKIDDVQSALSGKGPLTDEQKSTVATGFTSQGDQLDLFMAARTSLEALKSSFSDILKMGSSFSSAITDPFVEARSLAKDVQSVLKDIKGTTSGQASSSIVNRLNYIQSRAHLLADDMNAYRKAAGELSPAAAKIWEDNSLRSAIQQRVTKVQRSPKANQLGDEAFVAHAQTNTSIGEQLRVLGAEDSADQKNLIRMALYSSGIRTDRLKSQYYVDKDVKGVDAKNYLFERVPEAFADSFMLGGKAPTNYELKKTALSSTEAASRRQQTYKAIREMVEGGNAKAFDFAREAGLFIFAPERRRSDKTDHRMLWLDENRITDEQLDYMQGLASQEGKRALKGMPMWRRSFTSHEDLKALLEKENVGFEDAYEIMDADARDAINPYVEREKAAKAAAQKARTSGWYGNQFKTRAPKFTNTDLIQIPQFKLSKNGQSFVGVNDSSKTDVYNALNFAFKKNGVEESDTDEWITAQRSPIIDALFSLPGNKGMKFENRSFGYGFDKNDDAIQGAPIIAQLVLDDLFEKDENGNIKLATDEKTGKQKPVFSIEGINQAGKNIKTEDLVENIMSRKAKIALRTREVDPKTGKEVLNTIDYQALSMNPTQGKVRFIMARSKDIEALNKEDDAAGRARRTQFFNAMLYDPDGGMRLLGPDGKPLDEKGADAVSTSARYHDAVRKMMSESLPIEQIGGRTPKVASVNFKAYYDALNEETGKKRGQWGPYGEAIAFDGGVFHMPSVADRDFQGRMGMAKFFSTGFNYKKFFSQGGGTYKDRAGEHLFLPANGVTDSEDYKAYLHYLGQVTRKDQTYNDKTNRYDTNLSFTGLQTPEFIPYEYRDKNGKVDSSRSDFGNGQRIRTLQDFFKWRDAKFIDVMRGDVDMLASGDTVFKSYGKGAKITLAQYADYYKKKWGRSKATPNEILNPELVAALNTDEWTKLTPDQWKQKAERTFVNLTGNEQVHWLAHNTTPDTGFGLRAMKESANYKGNQKNFINPSLLSAIVVTPEMINTSLSNYQSQMAALRDPGKVREMLFSGKDSLSRIVQNNPMAMLTNAAVRERIETERNNLQNAISEGYLYLPGFAQKYAATASGYDALGGWIKDITGSDTLNGTAEDLRLKDGEIYARTGKEGSSETLATRAPYAIGSSFRALNIARERSGKKKTERLKRLESALNEYDANQDGAIFNVKDFYKLNTGDFDGDLAFLLNSDGKKYGDYIRQTERQNEEVNRRMVTLKDREKRTRALMKAKGELGYTTTLADTVARGVISAQTMGSSYLVGQALRTVAPGVGNDLTRATLYDIIAQANMMYDYGTTQIKKPDEAPLTTSAAYTYALGKGKTADRLDKALLEAYNSPEKNYKGIDLLKYATPRYFDPIAIHMLSGAQTALSLDPGSMGNLRNAFNEYMGQFESQPKEIQEAYQWMADIDKARLTGQWQIISPSRLPKAENIFTRIQALAAKTKGESERGGLTADEAEKLKNQADEYDRIGRLFQKRYTEEFQMGMTEDTRNTPLFKRFGTSFVSEDDYNKLQAQQSELLAEDLFRLRLMREAGVSGLTPKQQAEAELADRRKVIARNATSWNWSTASEFMDKGLPVIHDIEISEIGNPGKQKAKTKEMFEPGASSDTSDFFREQTIRSILTGKSTADPEALIGTLAHEFMDDFVRGRANAIASTGGRATPANAAAAGRTYAISNLMDKYEQITGAKQGDYTKKAADAGLRFEYTNQALSNKATPGGLIGITQDDVVAYNAPNEDQRTSKTYFASAGRAKKKFKTMQSGMMVTLADEFLTPLFNKNQVVLAEGQFYDEQGKFLAGKNGASTNFSKGIPIQLTSEETNGVGRLRQEGDNVTQEGIQFRFTPDLVIRDKDQKGKFRIVDYKSSEFSAEKGRIQTEFYANMMERLGRAAREQGAPDWMAPFAQFVDEKGNSNFVGTDIVQMFNTKDATFKPSMRSAQYTQANGEEAYNLIASAWHNLSDAVREGFSKQIGLDKIKSEDLRFDQKRIKEMNDLRPFLDLKDPAELAFFVPENIGKMIDFLSENDKTFDSKASMLHSGLTENTINKVAAAIATPTAQSLDKAYIVKKLGEDEEVYKNAESLMLKTSGFRFRGRDKYTRAINDLDKVYENETIDTINEYFKKDEFTPDIALMVQDATKRKVSKGELQQKLLNNALLNFDEDFIRTQASIQQGIGTGQSPFDFFMSGASAIEGLLERNELRKRNPNIFNGEEFTTTPDLVLGADLKQKIADRDALLSRNAKIEAENKKIDAKIATIQGDATLSEEEKNKKIGKLVGKKKDLENPDSIKFSEEELDRSDIANQAAIISEATRVRDQYNKDAARLTLLREDLFKQTESLTATQTAGAIANASTAIFGKNAFITEDERMESEAAQLLSNYAKQQNPLINLRSSIDKILTSTHIENGIETLDIDADDPIRSSLNNYVTRLSDAISRITEKMTEVDAEAAMNIAEQGKYRQQKEITQRLQRYEQLHGIENTGSKRTEDAYAIQNEISRIDRAIKDKQTQFKKEGSPVDKKKELDAEIAKLEEDKRYWEQIRRRNESINERADLSRMYSETIKGNESVYGRGKALTQSDIDMMSKQAQRRYELELANRSRETDLRYENGEITLDQRNRAMREIAAASVTSRNDAYAKNLAEMAIAGESMYGQANQKFIREISIRNREFDELERINKERDRIRETKPTDKQGRKLQGYYLRNLQEQEDAVRSGEFAERLRSEAQIEDDARASRNRQQLSAVNRAFNGTNVVSIRDAVENAIANANALLEQYIKDAGLTDKEASNLRNKYKNTTNLRNDITERLMLERERDSLVARKSAASLYQTAGSTTLTLEQQASLQAAEATNQIAIEQNRIKNKLKTAKGVEKSNLLKAQKMLDDIDTSGLYDRFLEENRVARYQEGERAALNADRVAAQLNQDLGMNIDPHTEARLRRREKELENDERIDYLDRQLKKKNLSAKRRQAYVDERMTRNAFDYNAYEERQLVLAQERAAQRTGSTVDLQSSALNLRDSVQEIEMDPVTAALIQRKKVRSQIDRMQNQIKKMYPGATPEEKSTLDEAKRYLDSIDQRSMVNTFLRNFQYERADAAARSINESRRNEMQMRQDQNEYISPAEYADYQTEAKRTENGVRLRSIDRRLAKSNLDDDERAQLMSERNRITSYDYEAFHDRAYTQSMSSQAQRWKTASGLRGNAIDLYANVMDMDINPLTEALAQRSQIRAQINEARAKINEMIPTARGEELRDLRVAQDYLNSITEGNWTNRLLQDARDKRADNITRSISEARKDEMRIRQEQGEIINPREQADYLTEEKRAENEIRLRAINRRLRRTNIDDNERAQLEATRDQLNDYDYANYNARAYDEAAFDRNSRLLQQDINNRQFNATVGNRDFTRDEMIKQREAQLQLQAMQQAEEIRKSGGNVRAFWAQYSPTAFYDAAVRDADYILSQRELSADMNTLQLGAMLRGGSLTREEMMQYKRDDLYRRRDEEIERLRKRNGWSQAQADAYLASARPEWSDSNLDRVAEDYVNNQLSSQQTQQYNAITNSKFQADMMARQQQQQFDRYNRSRYGQSTSRFVNAYYSQLDYKNNLQNTIDTQKNNILMTTATLGSMRERYDKMGAGEEKDALGRAIQATQNQLTGYNNALAGAEQQMEKFGKGSMIMAAGLQGIGSSVSMIMQRFGRQLFMKAVNEAKRFVKEFNATMTEIQMITLKSDSAMNTLGDGLITKAKELKVSVSEVSKSAATLYRQGLSDQEVSDRLDVISKFSKVSGTKVDDATKLITVAMNTGLVTDPYQAADIVTALGDNAATNAAQIEKGIEKAGAAAAADGTTFGQLAAMLTAITSTTQIGGNVAGRTLNTIFARMNKIGTNELIYDENGHAVSGSDVAMLLKNQGINMYDEKGNKRSSYDVLYALSQKWDSMSDAEQQQMATALAGTRQYSNFAAIMQGMSEGKVDEYMDLIGESGGITDKKFDIYAKSLEASLTQLRNTFDELIHDLTDSGALTGFIDTITGMIQGVDNLTKSFGGLGAMIATVLPMLVGISLLKAGLATANIGLVAAGVGAAAVGGIIASSANQETAAQRNEERNKNYQAFMSSYSGLDRLKELRSKGASRSSEENEEYAKLVHGFAQQLGLTNDAAGNAAYSIENLISALNQLSPAVDKQTDDIIKEAEERKKAAFASNIANSRSDTIVELEEGAAEGTAELNKQTGLGNTLFNGRLWTYTPEKGYQLRPDALRQQNTLVSNSLPADYWWGLSGRLADFFTGKHGLSYNQDIEDPLVKFYHNASSAGAMGFDEMFTTPEQWSERIKNGRVTQAQMEAAFNYMDRSQPVNTNSYEAKYAKSKEILSQKLNGFYDEGQIDYLAKKMALDWHKTGNATTAYNGIIGTGSSYEEIKGSIDAALVDYEPTSSTGKMPDGLEDVGTYGYYIGEDGKRYSAQEVREIYGRYDISDRERAIGIMQRHNGAVVAGHEAEVERVERSNAERLAETNERNAQLLAQYESDLAQYDAKVEAEAKRMHVYSLGPFDSPGPSDMSAAEYAYVRDFYLDQEGIDIDEIKDENKVAQLIEDYQMEKYGVESLFENQPQVIKDQALSETGFKDWNNLSKEDQEYWLGQARGRLKSEEPTYNPETFTPEKLPELDESKLIGGAHATVEELGKLYDDNGEILESVAEEIAEANADARKSIPKFKAQTNAFVESLKTYSQPGGWLEKNQLGVSSDTLVGLLQSGRFGTGADGLDAFMSYVIANPYAMSAWNNVIQGNPEVLHTMQQAKWDNTTKSWTAPDDIMEQVLNTIQSSSGVYGAKQYTTQQKAAFARQGFEGLTGENPWFISTEARNTAQDNAWAPYEEHTVKPYNEAITNVDKMVAPQEIKDAIKRNIRASYGNPVQSKEEFLAQRPELTREALSKMQGDYLKEALGEQLYGRVLEASSGGKALTDDELGLANVLLSNRSVGATSLSSRQQANWLKTNRGRLQTIGQEEGLSRTVADAYMAQWENWGEYAALIEARNTGNADYYSSHGGDKRLAELTQDLDNFEKQTQIKFDVEGIKQLEEAGKVAEGTASKLEKLRQGGKIAIEVETSFRTEAFDQAQMNAKLFNGTATEQDEAAMAILNMSREQYYANRDQNYQLAQGMQNANNTLNGDTWAALYNAENLTDEQREIINNAALAAGYEVTENNIYYDRNGRHSTRGYKYTGKPGKVANVGQFVGQEREYTDSELAAARAQIVDGTLTVDSNRELYKAAAPGLGTYGRQVQWRRENGKTISAELQRQAQEEARRAAEEAVEAQRLEELRLSGNTAGYAQELYRQNNKGALAANALYQSMAGGQIQNFDDFINLITKDQVRNWRDFLEASPDVLHELEKLGVKINEDGSLDFSAIRNAGDEMADVLTSIINMIAGKSADFNKAEEVRSTGETYRLATEYFEGTSTTPDRGKEAFEEVLGNPKAAQYVEQQADLWYAGAEERNRLNPNAWMYDRAYENAATEDQRNRVRALAESKGYIFDETTNTFGTGSFTPTGDLNPFNASYLNMLMENARLGIDGLTATQRYAGLQDFTQAAETGRLSELYNGDMFGAFNDYTSGIQDAQQWAQAGMAIEQANIVDEQGNRVTIANLDQYQEGSKVYGEVSDVLETMGMSYKRATELQRDFDETLQTESISAAVDYGDRTKDVVSDMEMFSKNTNKSRDAAKRFNQTLTQVANNQYYRDRWRAGKRDKETVGKIAEMLNVSEKFVKNKDNSAIIEAMLGDAENIDKEAVQSWGDAASESISDTLNEKFSTDNPIVIKGQPINLESGPVSMNMDEAINEVGSYLTDKQREALEMLRAWGIDAQMVVEQSGDKFKAKIVVNGLGNAGKKGGGGGGGGGGGKSAADKLLEEQKHQQAEAEHEVKMLEIQEKHYDRTNQYDNYLSHLDREIAAQEKLQSVYAKNVQELKDMMGSTAQGSEDWYKLRDALYAAEEKLSEINNTIDEINGKRIQIVSEKQENQDKPQSHKMTMIQTLAARYMSAKEFENYYKTMQLQIAAAREQISQNEAQIAEWEGMLTLYEENSDEWIEVRDKIWAMREENASLENQALEDMINMNQQKISQISEELQHSQAFDNHAVNMWSTYGGMYNANAQFADYRKALAEQNTGYENNIATYQVAIAGLRELLGTLDQSSDEWYSARDAIFEYEEAIASAKNSILENNQAIQESTVTEMTTDYDRMTGELEHEMKILQNQKQIYDNANDYEAYVEMMKKEKDATVDMVRSMQNSLAQMESTIGTIDEDSEAWWNLHDKILSVREAISEAEVNLENFDRQIEQSKIEHLLEKFGQVDEMSQHQIKMIQFQETKYQNAGELTNYGTMLGIENDYQQRYADDLKDHIRLLKEERDNVEAGSDVYFKLEQSIAKYEEQLESTNNTIEKNNRMLEQNQEKIRQTVMTVENTLDKEYRARIQKTRDMLAAEVNMQNTILDVIKARYNAEFNLEKNRINKLKESLNQEKSLINERLNARKNAVDQADQYEELAEYKRQLALLSADPTRTKEAKELQKKISDLEKSMAFDVASAEATAEGERIDDQMKAYDDYLTTAQEDLNMMLQDSEALMAAAQNDFGYNVAELMAGSWTDLLAWLQENNVNYRNATEELQTQMVNSWEDTWKKMWGIIDTYWDEISGLMDNSDDFLAYMQESDTYAAASETGKQSLTYGWAESYRNMLNALKDDASYDHIHELEDIIVSKIDEAKDWTYKVQLDSAYKDLVGGFSLSDYMNYGYGHTPVDTSDIFWDDLYTGIGKIVKVINGIEYTVQAASGSGGRSGSGSGKDEIISYNENDKLIKHYYIYGGPNGETILGEVDAEDYSDALAQWEAKNTPDKYDTTYVSGDDGTVETKVIKGAKSVSEQLDSFADALSSVMDLVKPGVTKTDPNKKNVEKKYASGGLVDYTGLAWVDGSFSDPEAFLSAADTKNIQALTNALSYVSVPTYGVPNMGEFTSNTQNIGDVYVTINQASLESDADLDYVATQVGKKFTKQLSKQGFNLNTVSF